MSTKVYIALKYDRCGADAQAQILGVYSTRQLAVMATAAHIKTIDPDFEVMNAPGIVSVDDEAFTSKVTDYDTGHYGIQVDEFTAEAGGCWTIFGFEKCEVFDAESDAESHD